MIPANENKILVGAPLTVYYTVDGVSANVTVPGVGNSSPLVPVRGNAGTLPSQTALGTTQSLASVDALQEFRIQTSTYSAEYGRQPGGQIELTTRSGTNTYHGTLFNYFRNTALDANNWFANNEKIPRQPEHQNDFGGTIAGPLHIPDVYDGTDKTFFFFSYEGLRLDSPGFSGIVNVPTQAFRQAAAPGVRTFLDSLPLPNGPNNNDLCMSSLGPGNPAFSFSCTGQWSAGFSARSSFDSISVRFDQHLGKRIQLFARYADVPSSQENPAAQINQFTTTNLQQKSITVGVTANLSHSVINEGRFNYSFAEARFQQVPTPGGGAVPYPRSAIFPPAYLLPNASVSSSPFVGLPGQDFTTYPSYANYSNNQHQFNLIDAISTGWRSHNLKFGVDFRHLSPDYNPYKYLPEIDVLSPTGVQQGFADQATILAFRQARPTFVNLSVFAEDQWRILSRLSLSLGLRWEYNPSPGASDGVYPLAFTTSNVSTTQLASTGTPQYQARYDNFAPRIGFAFNPWTLQNHPLVVRGGFGIFFDTGQALGAAGYAYYPFYGISSLSNIPLPASAQSLAPPPLLSASQLVAPYPFMNVSDPNLRLPYTEQWNLSVDYGLISGNVLTTSYIGNSGHLLLFQQYYPSGVPGNPLFAPPLYFNSNAGSSSYNAFQIQDSGRIKHAMHLVASYTWAHAIDTSSTDLSFNGPLRGNSDNDLRHVFNAAMNYKLPLTNSRQILSALLGGWSLDSRLFAESGFPIDVNQGVYILADGHQQFIRPDLVHGVPVYLHDVSGALGRWALNPAGFSPVPTDPNTGAPLRLGTLGRNYVHGPNFWALNTALQRNFKIHEPFQLLFRLEGFNVFNHPNAGNIDPNLADSTFGRSQGSVPTIGAAGALYAAGLPRSIQIALKLNF